MLNQLRDVGGALSKVTERWVPDAWVILMSLTVVALILAIIGGGASPEEAVLAWGSGVWTLLELAMQFSIAMVAAHACASSPPIYRVLDRLAGLPDPEKPALRSLQCFPCLLDILTGRLVLLGPPSLSPSSLNAIRRRMCGW